MKKIKSHAFFYLFLCLGLLATANNAVAKEYTIGLSMHFMRDDYAAKVVDTIKAEAAKYPGSKVIVTDANSTPQKQIADMENLIIQNVDAIIVVPIDEKAILQAIKRANTKNIPVVAITKIPGAKVLTTIGANGDYQNGKATGELMIKETGGKGKVAIIGMPYSLWRIDQREKGFMDVIKDSELTIAVRQASTDQAGAHDKVASILLAHPDLVGIWCTFSNQIVGAADALRMANRKDVVLTGIDADKAIIQRIKKGWVTGSAAQFPGRTAELAAQAAFDHLQGKPVAENYDVPVELVTSNNVAEMDKKIWGE